MTPFERRSCILVNCAGNGSLRAAAWRSTWGLAWAGSRFLRDVWKSFRSSSNLPVDTRTTEWRTGKLPGGTPQSWNIKSQMMEKSSVTEMSITQSQSAVRGVMNAPTPCLGWILVWWQKPGQVSWQQLSLWADLVFSALSCSVFHKTTAKK